MEGWEDETGGAETRAFGTSAGAVGASPVRASGETRFKTHRDPFRPSRRDVHLVTVHFDPVQLDLDPMIATGTVTFAGPLPPGHSTV